MYGPYQIAVHAHLNSIQMDVVGDRKIEFPDGGVIIYQSPSDLFFNTLFGTLSHLCNGKIRYEDK
jgi:hypothetical protein